MSRVLQRPKYFPQAHTSHRFSSSFLLLRTSLHSALVDPQAAKLTFLVLAGRLRGGHLVEAGQIEWSLWDAFRIENGLWFLRIQCNGYDEGLKAQMFQELVNLTELVCTGYQRWEWEMPPAEIAVPPDTVPTPGLSQPWWALASWPKATLAYVLFPLIVSPHAT